jgi:hypothetical protein
MIGALTVDYSSASLQDFPNDSPNIRDRVRVRGSLTAAGVLNASALNYVSQQLPGEPGSAAFLDSFVTSVTSSTSAEVNGHTIILSGDQVCAGPPIAYQLVQVQGLLQADGTATAHEFCEYSYAADVEITGTLSAIDPTLGTLSVLGFAIQPSLVTSVNAAGGAALSAADLRVGDHIVAGGTSGGIDATVLATFLQEDSSQATSIHAERAQLRFQSPLVYVLGRPITITPATAFNNFNPPTDMASFFKNPNFPHLFPDCGPPDFLFSVTQNPDGSLTALSVTAVVPAGC